MYFTSLPGAALILATWFLVLGPRRQWRQAFLGNQWHMTASLLPCCWENSWCALERPWQWTIAQGKAPAESQRGCKLEYNGRVASAEKRFASEPTDNVHSVGRAFVREENRKHCISKKFRRTFTKRWGREKTGNLSYLFFGYAPWKYSFCTLRSRSTSNSPHIFLTAPPSVLT